MIGTILKPMPKTAFLPNAAPGPVHLMENHDEAYWIWKKAGIQGEILVHMDAHDDLSWVANRANLDIGNFICQALKEGMVREVYWVVPDQTLESVQNLKPVLRRLKRLRSKYPEPRAPFIANDHQIDGALLGKPFRVCSLRRLPRFSEEVLLDIDVDYLTIPRACHDNHRHGELPWRWPEELLHGLEACGLQASLTTVAYSVEGGYTPLKWKYLGDELAWRWGGKTDSPPIQGANLLRQGAMASRAGDLHAAEAHYLRARELWPEHPAPQYHLAHLYLEMGDAERARKHYRGALDLDPSYRTAYNSQGIWWYWQRRWPRAEQEHHNTLALDPQDPYALLGLGQLAVKRRLWGEAEAWLKRALEADGRLVDAHRSLGFVFARQKRRREAIAAYEKSLRLALAGHKPLAGPILTVSDGHPLADPGHFEVHAALGHLYYLQKDPATAIVEYRMAIAARCDSLVIRWRLALLYRRQGEWRQALREAGGAVKRIPLDLFQGIRRFWRRRRQDFKNWRAMRAR
jgi:tetratricopeptide (TPR) repeat protein